AVEGIGQVVGGEASLDGGHPAVVDEHSGGEREIALLLYRQAVDVLAFLQYIDANDRVVVAVLVPPMVVKPDEALHFRSAALATSHLVRYFLALCAAPLASIVVPQDGRTTYAISGDRSEEVLAAFSHVTQD